LGELVKLSTHVGGAQKEVWDKGESEGGVKSGVREGVCAT